MSLCEFPGCDRDKHTYKHWCGPHYKQSRRGVEMTALYNKSGEWTLESLLKRTVPDGDCLVWAKKIHRRYPTCWHLSTGWAAHRLAYHLSTGEDIKGIPLHHKCANNLCINPNHLQKASTATNTLEMMARKAYVAEIAQLKARVAELEAELERRVDPVIAA